MAVFSLKKGDLEDREKLLEADNPEEAAEELGVEIEKLEPEELKEYLVQHYRETGVEEEKNIEVMTRKALQHFLPALKDRENRVLYGELEE